MRTVHTGRPGPLRRLATVALLLVVPGCGGGGSPTGPGTPPPVSGFSVSAVVFHDDNGDGRLDVNEGSRVPDVQVEIGGRSGRSEAGSGRATINGVPGGDQALGVDSLPPFFQAPATPPRVTVPSQDDVPVGLTLPIGDNNERTYMAYGDSITFGVGSSDGSGYRRKLEDKLRAHFGGAVVLNEGRDANATERGLRLIPGALAHHRPAYAIIMLGLNDWQDLNCQQDVSLCPIVVSNLRGMVRRCKENRTLPVVSTLPAVNPAVNDDRNRWNEGINAQIRTMAAQEGGVLVADVYAAMRARSDLPSLYADGNDVHPNDAGYDVIAEALFQAIAHGRLE